MTERRYDHSEDTHSLLKKLVTEGRAKRIRRFDLSQGVLYSVVDPEVAVIERWFSPAEDPGFTSGMSPFLYVVGRSEDIQRFEEEYHLKLGREATSVY